MKDYKVYLEDGFKIKRGYILSNAETEQEAINSAITLAKHNHPEYDWNAYKVESN